MRDNGLTAAAYTSMGGIDPLVAEPVLAALAEAGIAAYAGPRTPEPGSQATAASPGESGPADGPSAAATPTTTSPASSTDPGSATADTDDTDDTDDTADPAPDPAGPAAAPAESRPGSGEQPSSSATPPAPSAASAARGGRRWPDRFEEIFVDAAETGRARTVIDRSTEDAEWKSLVAQFDAPSAAGHDAPTTPRWPAGEDVAEGSYEPLIDVPAGLDASDRDQAADKPRARRDDDPHDHFVPPEPPRGPKLDWISRLAWLGLFGGPLLLILAAIFDAGSERVLLTGVIAFVAGFLTLVLRMKDRLPPDDTPDDGAVV